MGLRQSLAGHPEKSYLIDQIKIDGGKAEMPKDKKPLSQIEIDLIARWIKEGAKDDSPANAVTKFDMANPPTYERPPVITCIDYSPDGKWLAVSAYHEVVVYKADGSEIVSRLVGLSERIESVAFSPDSERLVVAGGSPGRRGEVQIWKVSSKELLLSKTEGFDTLYGASWSPDGKSVAFGAPDNVVRSIDASTGEQKLFNGAHNDWVFDTVWTVKGDHLVSVSRDRSVKLVNIGTQRFIDNITSITPGALKGGLHAVDRHPTKDEIVAAGADGAPKIYRVFRLKNKARKIGDDFNKIRAFEAMQGRVFDARFNHDGSQLVACSSYNGTGQLRVYKTDDGKKLTSVDVAEGGLFTADFSKDGKLVATGGFDGNIRIYEVATGKLIKSFPPVPLEEVTASK